MIVMTNRGRAVVLVVALALAASLLALAVVLAKPAQAQAQTFTDTDETPFTFFLGGCTGETAVVEGTMVTVAHTTIDANGGFHDKFQFRLQGQGEGQLSGDKYVFNWVGNLNRNFAPGALPTVTQPETFQIIHQGETTTDDLQGKVVFHITVNAQGEVTTEVQNVEFVCT
jgi:hypothetical protein